MAGLGQALTGVNQANQRAEALRRFNPSALAGAEQFLGLDPQQQQMFDLRFALLKRMGGGEQPGRDPDEARDLAHAALVADRTTLGTGARDDFAAERATLADFAPQPGTGGGGMPPEFAAILGGLQSPRTRGELARMEPQLRALEQMLAAEQQRAMQQELARMKEQGLLGRAEAKEKAVGERFETKEQRLAREHGETLKQRGEIAGKTDETTRTLRVETERYHREMADLRRQALNLQKIALERAFTKQERDQVFQLDRAYQQRVGNIANLRDAIISSARDANEPMALRLEEEAEALRAMLDPLLETVGATEAKRRGVTVPKPGKAAPVLEDDDALLDAFGIK